MRMFHGGNLKEPSLIGRGGAGASITSTDHAAWKHLEGLR